MQNLALGVGNESKKSQRASSARSGPEFDEAAFARSASENRQARAALVGLGLIGLVGGINLIAVRGLDLDFFYLLLCGLIGWHSGASAALLGSAVAGAFLLMDSWLGMPGMAHWALWCNAFLRMLMFAVGGLAASEIGARARNLERSVGERTSWLESEVQRHKETLAQLRDTLQLFRHLTENITEVFWVADPSKSKLNYVSSGYERIFGREREALYSSPEMWLAGIDEADQERVARAMRSNQEAGFDEEYRVVRPDGSMCWVHDRAFPVKNDKGDVFRLVGITQDITASKRSQELLQAQRDVAVALSLTSDLTTALEGLLESVTKLEGIDCGGVYLLDREAQALSLEGNTGLEQELVSRVLRFASSTTGPQIIREWEAASRAFTSADKTGKAAPLHAIQCLCLEQHVEAMGWLVVGSYAQREIPDQTRIGLESIAAQVAGAIVRMRAERQIVEISDREQARVGQDIHDGLCQQLVGAAFDSRSLQRTLGTEHRPEAKLVERICAMLDEAITESRRVARGLYPVRLESEGLVPALQELAARTGERFAVRASCRIEGSDCPCDFTTATHLYRIAQEAINNSVKHSGAREITLQLHKLEDALELEIADNGKGLAGAALPASGMGLHIMDYRARSLGGKLEVKSSSAGTTISCRAPLRKEKA